MAALVDAFAMLAIWTTWNNETRAGSKNLSKVPYAIDGRRAKSDDPSTWMTYFEAEECRAARGHGGVNIMLTGVADGLALGGIDLDACLGEEGDLAPWAADIVAKLDSYTEVSPSGTGLKIFFRHDPAITLDPKHRWTKHVQKPNPNGKDFGIEQYLEKHFLAVTEIVYQGYTTLRTIGLDVLYAVRVAMARFKDEPKVAVSDAERLQSAIDALPNNDLSWLDWNTRGMAIYAATGGTGYDAFLRWSRKSSKFDERNSRERWDNWRRSPPDQVGEGTIFHHALDAGWQDPNRGVRANGHARPNGHAHEWTHEPTGESSFEEEAKQRIRDELGPFPDPHFITAPDLIVLDIPRRMWVLGRTLLRGNISGMIGGGAVGKSSLILGMAVSIITGRDLIGDEVHEQGKCWVHNCEDDKVETRRRLAALLQHHKIPDDDVIGQLAISSGLDHRLTIAMKAGFGGFIDLPHVRNCIDFIKGNGITFAAFDPFIGMTRGINENDNAEVDAVCDGYRRIAYETGACILIAQHTGKPPRGRTGVDPGDPMVSRGAVAFVNGMRIAQQLTTFDKQMAEEVGVASVDHYRYLRRDDGKLNLSLKTNEAIAFYSRESIHLDNGDDVGVIVPADIGKKEETGTVANIQDRVDERALLTAINIRELNGTRFLLKTDPALIDYMTRSPRNWKPRRYAFILKNCHHEDWIKYVKDGRNRGYSLTTKGRDHLFPPAAPPDISTT